MKVSRFRDEAHKEKRASAKAGEVSRAGHATIVARALSYPGHRRWKDRLDLPYKMIILHSAPSVGFWLISQSSFITLI